MTTTNTAVYFGHSWITKRFWRPRPSVVWTCVGGLAIPLWATWPALSVQTRAMPSFECITIIFTVSWLVMRYLERRTPHDTETHPGCHRWLPAVAFALGESGATAFFVFATHYIGPAEANLVSYLWPGVTVGLGAVLRIFHLKLRHVVGIVLGFVGAATLFGVRNLEPSYVGIGLALLGAVSWASYCVFRLKWKAVTQRILTKGFALSAILCASLHFLSESSVLPSVRALMAAVAIGIIPGALANWTWDQGFRRGDSQLLAVMAYATPLCSALLLATLGFEGLTWNLLGGALLIALAGVLSRADVERNR